MQCQVCFKYGHPASDCYHPYDQNYQLQVPANFQGFQTSSNPWNQFLAAQQHYGSYQPNNFPNFADPWGMMPRKLQFPQQFQQSHSQEQAQNPPGALITNSGVLGSCPTTSSTWFPDSGASYHATADQNNIHQLSSFECPDQIFIGNRQGLHISSSGSSYFNHLLNLISVSHFARDNLVF